MGLLDDYMSESAPNKTTAKVTNSGSSLIDSYLSSGEDKAPAPKPNANGRIELAPNPVADVILSPKEQKDLAAQPRPNPRDSDLTNAVKSYPSNLLSTTLQNFRNASETVGSGVSDIMSNKPASGVGKVGLGVLAGVTAAPNALVDETISKPIANITGSEDIGNRAGLVAGFGVPVGKTGQATVAALPKNKALSSLVESIGHENLPTLLRDMKSNPRLSPADLSPRVMQDTQRLFVTEGPHQNHLANMTAQRAGTAKAAAEGALDEHLGQTVDAVKKLSELKTAARTVGQEQINPAVQGAKPVDLTPVVSYIDARIKPGIQSLKDGGQLPSTEINQQLGTIRKILTDDKQMRFDANTLHDVQSVLRHEATNLLNSSDGQARRMGNAIMGVRNQIVDAIDTASAGKYKPALSNYRDEMQIGDAFKHGHDAIIRSGKPMENRPEFFKEWVDKATDAEKNAAKEGARVAIDTAANGFRSPVTNPASKAVQMAQVNFNRQRIESLFGKEEASQLFKKLDDERKIADTNVKLVEGSQTAMRGESKAKFELPKPSDMATSLIPPAILEGASAMASGTPLVGTAVYAGIKGASKVKDAIAMKLAKEHNSNYAKYALPDTPEARTDLIQKLDAIASTPPKQSILRKVTGALQP
jgi:hypothetical protein